MSKYEFDGDKVKKLYGAMQKLGYQQSLGEFEKGFYGKDNYQKRKAVYDVMTENGADLGSSYEDFIGRMRATAPLTTGSKQTSNPERKALFPNSPLERTNYKAKRAAAILDGGGGAFLRDQEVLVDEGYRLVSSKLASERVEDPKSKRLVTKPKKYSVPESDVREGGSMVRMVDAYKTVDGRAVPIPSAATGTQGNENQDEDFATQYISGKINREEYKKKAKAKDSEAAIANSQPTMESDEEFLYRTDKRYKEYRDKILNGDGDIDELSPETKAWYLQRIEARIKDAEERQKKYLSIINSDEHQKKLEENNTDFWRNFSQARGGIGAIGREQAKSMLRETDYSDEMNLANAGLGATESELTDLHALRDMLKGKDVGFFRRFKDFFGNRNNLTFGYQDFVDNSALIANKNSKNPLMSSAAESRAKEAEAATMYSRSANLRAKGGDVTGQMLPFVIEMASAGSMTSVAGNATHKAVYSLGTRILKSAALKGMEDGLLKATGTAALKVGTRGLSWIAHGLTAGALQTVTAGAGETTANITGRMVGHGAQQEDGSYAFEGGEGAVGAVLHGFTSQLIENATEFMGGGLGYGVGKVASKLTKPLAKVGLGGVTDFFGRIAASPISKATSKTLSKFQIQGIPEEIGEEYLGWAGHSMAGDGDAEWSDFADFQKHKELWATMALSVGAMGAFAASGHVPSLLKRRGRSLKMADRAAAGAFSDEEKWNALRDKLDGTDNNNVLRSLYDNVMQDKSLNGRERKAAMLYAGNLLAYRGANLGAIAGKRLALEQKRSDAEDARRTAMVEGAAPSGAESVDEHELDGDDVVSSAFRQGYEETSAANAYLWAKALEDQEGHAMESLGLSEKELNEKFSPQNAGETLNEIRGAKEGTYTEEQKKAAFDYANTRAAYEGVVERTQDDIDSEIAYHHAIVDRQTNIDSGRLHPVKLFTSEKNKRDDAFLVSGRLAFEYNDQGEPVVSTRLSDPTLIVSDAAGRTRMVSPSEIADAEDAIDVDEYKNTLAGHVRQEMEERKYAEMLKAAEEAQANEIGEGEPESPAVDGVSTSEEEKETPEVNENGEQSTVFGGAFNVGDKFSTEDGEFEVVQLTEGEAPIVQNVETGQQFRPHSEEDLRAAVRSYTPAFIDGAENTNGVTTYSRVAQEETAPQNEAQEDSHQEEVAPKPNEAQQEDGTTSENESVDEEQEGLTEDSDSSPSDSQSENTQEESTISLEEVQSALDKGDIEGITSQMAHDALYGDPDLETEEVDAIVENSRSASQANLAKLQKTEIKPRKNESVIAFKKRKAEHAGALAHAEELVRFWEDVQEHRRNLGAQAMQEEENAKQQREAEAAERAKEQAENGLAVAPSWANAEKIVGRPGEFITPNGLRVKGHYVLVESGAAVPSHDARHGFKQSEGFPTDEKGHTLNDRDYERDLDAQRVQREISRNYDARATQQPVVVSPEGFVLSGNGRTMSGDLAAMENTDGAYNSYVREYAEMWGFTSDQVEKLEHPRVVFVSDNPLPLTTETFAAFNAQETKTQSRTEKAVKMGKAVSDEDFAKILRIVTDGHETLADFYGNMSGVSEVINLLETSGVITQQDRANLFDGDALSDEGRNLLENVLLGKAFEGNPDVVRQLSEVRSLRTSVLNALFYIVENERLNEEFRLSNELSRAINFVYHARKGGGYSFGDKVRTFVQQTELFESTTDVTLDDATVLLLADALNDKRTTLIKSIFKSYNERAEDAGKGQMSLFGDAIPSRDTLIMETLALLGVDIKDYAPSNQVEPSQQETNEQQEPKQQQLPEAGTSEPSIESTSEQGAEGKTETELSSGSVSTSGRGNEGVSTEEEGAKPSDKNAKPSEKSSEKGKTNKGKKKQTSPSSKKPTRVLVSEEQHLKNQARLKELLRGTTLNVGINPEILALGIQEAAYYLEGGIRTFVDFASKMVEAFGDDVRPYVKAFYNGARDMPELAELGIDKEMTPYDEVREFDVGNFDKASETENENGNEAATPIENDTPKVKGESPEQRAGQGDFAVGQTVYFKGQPWEVKSISSNGNLEIFHDFNGTIIEHKNIRPNWVRESRPEPTQWEIRVAQELAKEKESKAASQPKEKDKSKPKQKETTIETASESKENEEQSDLFSQSNLGEEKQEPKSSSLEVGQKVKYRTSSGNLRDAEVKALNYDGTIHLLVDLPLGAIPTINVPNAKMSDIVVDESTQQEKTQQQKKEKQPSKTNKKNGQRNKSTHGSVGTETREDARPTQRGRVDRSDSGDNVPDGSGSTRVSSVSREEGQRSTTDVKPESSDKGTETDQKEDKNLNSRSFHQTVAEAESLADENNTPAKRYRANIAAIKLVHQLEEEGRLENATPEEQKVLASYSSWGGLGVYFGNSAQSKVDELREVLTDEEFEDAVSSLSSGYFTPPHIVEGMWEVLRHLGFKGGRVFEGSAGVGGMLTLMPSDMLKNSSIRAVEKDRLTAKILKALHPDADVFSGGIEDVNAAPSSVDVAITNVPFVSGVRPVDKRNTDITRLNLDLHDFAIAKNVRLLAPGGVGIFMTTSLTLDKGNKLKEWLNTNGEADVLGAFRFNNETFAGAPVTTDVIVIRKRDKGMVSPHAVRVLDNHVERVVSYVDEKTREEKPLQVSYNNYFHEHPEFMGGRMFAGTEKGDTFRPSSIGLYPDPSIDQKSQWEKWVGTFESMDKPLESVVPSEEEELEESSLPIGTLTVNSQGQLGVVDNFSKIRPIEDDGKKVKSKYTKAELLEDYNRVKEAVRAVLDYQLNNLEDDGLKAVLKELNKAYDDFVNKYGVFHNNQAIRILKNDADYQGIAALERVKEHRNEKTRKIEAQVSKSDFFTQRTLGGLEELKASTIEDGLRLSMSKKNRIDSEFIAGLLNREVSDVEKELLDKEFVYRNPTTGLLEDKASYLSGNVREKLSVAEAQNADGQYTKNINALTSVLPPTIPSHLISTPLGGTWFSPDYFRNFLAEVYGSRVVFYRVGSQWHMDGIVSPLHARGGVRSDLLRSKGTSRTKYHWTVEELTLAAMNNVAPKAQATISKTDYNMPSEKTTIKISDEEASRAIIARMADLKDEFQSWMSKKMQEDPKAAAELEKSYNERFNSHVPYRADNSLIPEHFEGSNPAITLRSHQAAAAVRAVNSPTLLAHEVGTGKTFTMITAAAEMKRLGTANKPMIVVQNATLNQFASEAKKLYPAAKILVYDANRDKGTDGRKAFYARIKYGDWDMIVAPQSVLDLIPDDPQQKEAYLNQAVDDMLALAEQTEDRNVKREIEKQIESLLRRQSTSSSGNGRNNSQRSLKDQEVAKEKAEDKAERRMMRHTDEVAHFGEMGVDALIVDEAHEYKHLGFATTMTRVKGIDPSASKKAVSLYLKTRHILENNGWKNVVFATGTPVSNTAAEVWTFMRYLVQPETLKQLQLYYFDDFVHNFGKIEQRLEFSTNGQFKEQTRFAGYQGLPELARVWASIADTVLAKDTDIKRPKRDNGQGEDADQDIFLEQTPSLVRIMQAVKAKLEEFEEMSGAEKKKNSHIPLTMFGLASAAAIDTRLVSSNAIDEPGSKTNAAVERTLESLEDTKKERGTVAIFADKFRRFDTTEDGKRVVGFNLFEDIREKLIARGVPAEQIVIMQEGMSDKAKADIFAKVNAGEIRVIMGSTQRLGVGVNIQERLNLLIHMDAPARPMDYTQRNGRILRQGNLYEEWGKPVHVVRFGVKDSLDVSAYQRLQTKEGFIRPIMESQRTMDNAMTQRSVEEDEGEFDNPVAQLSGSQYALLLQKAKREVRKYEAYEAQWKQDQTFIPQQLRKNAGLARNAQILLSSAEARLEMLRSIVPQGKVQDVALHLKDGGVAHNEDAIKLANSAINAIAKEIRAEQTSNERTLSLSFTLDNVKVEIRASLMGIQKFDEKTKTISTSVSTSLQWSSEDLGVKDEPLLVHRLGDALNYITESVISGAEAEEQIERAKGQLERLEKENASLHERQGMPFKYADELKRARGLATDFEQKMQEELKEQEARYAERMNKNGDFVVDDLEVDEMIMSQVAEQEAEEQEEGKAREQRTANENALDGVSPEQIELRDGLVDIMRDAGMDVSVSDAEGQRVLDLARGATVEADAVREAREIERVNAVFNDELDAFSEDNANRIIFSLGRPSEVLRAAGVPDMPMKLYGSKLLKKIKKHGFDKVALRDLPRAVANPIAVFNNRKQEGNRAILTELHTEQGNVLVAIDLGKGADVDFNVVSSVFGKGKNGVVEWINKRQFTYVDEEKALNYLHLAAPIAAASDNQKLSLAANVINGLKKTKLSGENLRQQRKNSITEEMQSIKTKAQSDGTFMLAPNGEPTNLTERQWLQVRTDAFKEWFGDWENDPEEASQMKDENGEPKVFYHNTNADFFAFNPLYNGSSTDAGWLGDGFYFYGDPSEGQDYGEKKMSVFLNIREPYYASEEENRSLSEQNDRSASLEFREERESEGYDGVYFNGDLRQETVVFSPTQIKSATDNVGTFDASKEDIREQRVWHGTPHDFNHFDHSKMGTGEGNQTFGWGTYLTGDKNSGVYYATLRRSSFNPSAPIPIEKSEVLKLGMVLEHRAKVMSAEQALANAIASGTSEEVAVLKEKLEKARKSLRDWVSKVSGDVQAKEKDFKKWREERDKELEYWKENHDAWSAYLMSVEIPDTETHRYLNWSESVPAEELSRINAALEERGYAPLELGEDATGELVYEKLGVGTDKENSEFLHDALGYVGIEYPAGSKMTGYEGDEHNYVIFDESDAKIIDKVKLFRGQHGEVRGFAVGGRIYLDPKMASDETAIHEYTHLWADALRRVNPAEWENVKDLLRGTPIWEETKRLYPELADDEDALADEVLAQFSGKHGAKRLAEAREKAMSEADGVFDKAKVASVFDNVRQALKRFWKGVADFLGLHFTSAEEVADKVLVDLLNGVNPRNIDSSAYEAPTIREQRIDNDTREEMQRSVDELRVEVREGYEKAVKDWKYKMQEQWQDSMLALKTLQDELEKKGVKIEEWENAYWAENRMSSMNEEEMKAYTRDYFKPIVAAQIAASKALPQELTDKLNAMDAHLREFDKMDAEEKQRNAVDNYLMLKHGLERNRVLAMRDAIDAQWKNPSEASSVWRAYNEDAGNRENHRLLQEGKRSFEEFLQVDDAIRAHYAGEEYLKNREKDYSGLTSMTTEELTELKDVENAALQLVKEAEDAAGVELSALWDKVNKATRESVEKLYKSGLLTPAAYSQMTTMFQWYVPLRGFAEETSDEVYDYVDQRNGNGMGAVLKGADGRKSKADSPIAHIGSMAERSVVQGNRNLMKQHFYRMVMAHPNDLVSMGEIYLHHNEVTDEWEMMTPTHSPNASPEQIAEETRAFEERMQELVKQEPDNYLRLREHPDVPYRVLGSNLGEHQVLVKVLGRDKLLTVNGDPRVAQAVNGLFNPDAISNDFLKRLRNLNNFLAQMATQRNPEFIFRNLIRDRFYAMEAARVKEGAIDPQYMGRLQKNWISAVGQVVGLTARYNSGTLDMNDAQDRMFYEFMMNGGATGVTRLLNPEEYKGEIADIAKEMQRGKFHYAKVAKLVTKYVDLFGSVSEAITRFATYRTSRELGRSVARSVWDAKEITTNFNKKGAGSKAIRKDDGRWLRMSGETASFFKNFVIFTNANVQGFHNQWQLAKNNPKRFIAHFVAKWVALGFAMPLINNLLVGLFGGDDDHYQDLPETARRNSLCLFVPKVGWVKIPLGFGLRSAYALGGLLSERLFYPKGDYTSMTRSLFNIALDLMPLSMGSSEQDWWLNVVPSSLRPLAENIANKDWTGRPIVNEYTNENWPEYRRANNHTSPVSVYISEKLSDWTGGDEYTPGFVNLNPSQFEHIALGLLSGVGTLVGNTYETTANLILGEELDTRHIPFLKDFYSTSSGATHTSAVKRNFYALKDEYEKTKVRVLGYEREEADGKNDPESVARRVDFTKNSAEYKRYEVMDEAVSEVNSLRNDLKEATTPEEVKALEAEMQQVMEDAINDVRAIK